MGDDEPRLDIDDGLEGMGELQGGEAGDLHHYKTDGAY